MLDENLPTFHFKPPPHDNPNSSVIYFTQNGSDPTPEYVFQRADASSNPASRGKYAAALTDPYNVAVVYAEVLVEPDWQQPTLSAAELRAQDGIAAAPVPLVPDRFAVQLYDPDQTIAVRLQPGGFTKTDAWEFDMPTQSFRMPSASQIDRERERQQTASPPAVGGGAAPQATDGPVRDLTPKIMFKWKRDGRLSKDMTCYMVGKSLGRHKSKEPDITVALYKQGREPAVTVYEPNLRRVEVEDRKGLDIVLLLSAEVIRDLYVVPRSDVFNIAGASTAAAAAAAKRKNGRPTPPPPGVAMSGALGGPPPTHLGHAAAVPPPPPPAHQQPLAQSHAAVASSGGGGQSAAAIDAETKRLQALVDKEQTRDRARRDKEEQKRIKRMLEAEDKERRRREADVAKETERLRKVYGVEGQDLPTRSSQQQQPPPPPQQSPALPPRPAFGGAGPPPQLMFAAPPPAQGGYHPFTGPPPAPGGGWFAAVPPPRPVSAGPAAQGSYGGAAGGGSTLGSWWRGPGGQASPPPGAGRPGKKRSGSGPYAGNAGPSVSGFFGGLGGGRSAEEDRRRVQKKRSVHF